MGTITISNSTITITPASNERAYLAVEFEDAQANSNGKRVELSRQGTVTGVLAWTNATTPGANDRALAAGVTEYIRFDGPNPITAQIRKANDPSAPISSYADYGGIALASDFDAGHALKDSTFRVKGKQWTFADGDNRVIVTIVMQDDQGGGDLFGPKIGDAIVRDKRLAIQLQVNGKALLYTIPDVELPE